MLWASPTCSNESSFTTCVCVLFKKTAATMAAAPVHPTALRLLLQCLGLRQQRLVLVARKLEVLHCPEVRSLLLNLHAHTHHTVTTKHR